MAKTTASYRGKWPADDKQISMNLPLIVFKEDDAFIFYCPALDLTGCGMTEHEAEESFNISLGEFFLYTTRKNTLKQVLSEMGWTIKKSKSKTMTAPSMSSLLDSNYDFKRIFDSHEFRKLDKTVEVPLC